MNVDLVILSQGPTLHLKNKTNPGIVRSVNNTQNCPKHLRTAAGMNTVRCNGEMTHAFQFQDRPRLLVVVESHSAVKNIVMVMDHGCGEVEFERVDEPVNPPCSGPLLLANFPFSK